MLGPRHRKDWHQSRITGWSDQPAEQPGPRRWPCTWSRTYQQSASQDQDNQALSLHIFSSIRHLRTLRWVKSCCKNTEFTVLSMFATGAGALSSRRPHPALEGDGEIGRGSCGESV